MKFIVMFFFAAVLACASAGFLASPVLGRTTIAGPSGIITKDEGLYGGFATRSFHGNLGLGYAATPLLRTSPYLTPAPLIGRSFGAFGPAGLFY